MPTVDEPRGVPPVCTQEGAHPLLHSHYLIMCVSGYSITEVKGLGCLARLLAFGSLQSARLDTSDADPTF